MGGPPFRCYARITQNSNIGHEQGNNKFAKVALMKKL